MPEIILTEEQARILREAKEAVILHDSEMTVRIVSEPYDAVALADFYRQRTSGIEEEGLTSEELTALFKALDAERVRRGRNLSEEEVEEFAKRWRNSDAA